MGDETWKKAQDRLNQVQKHIESGSKSSAKAHEPKDSAGQSTANTTRRRARRKQDDDALPADYSDILGQVKTLQQMAITPDLNNRGYQRQKKAGKLWVRERVEEFLDPGTFREVGSVSGTVKWTQLGPEREEPESCRFMHHLLQI
jgi:hypothetical protein